MPARATLRTLRARSSGFATLAPGAAVCALATAWVAWPMRSFDFPFGDTAFTALWMRHLGHLRSFTDGPAARPSANSIAQNDWVLGEGLVMRPFEGLGALGAHEAVVIVGLFATAWACQRLAAALLGEGPHTWVAGLIGGLNPIQTAHAMHANLVHHQWTALAALLVGAGGWLRRPWLAFAGGVVAAGSFHFGFYLGMQTALVTAAAATVGSIRTALATLGGAALAGLTVLPVARTYAAAGSRFDVLELERRVGSWDPTQTLRPLDGVPLHAPLSAFFAQALPTDPPNPGYLALVLATIGVFVAPRDRRLLAVILALLGAAALAIGPELVWNGVPTGIPGVERLVPALAETRGPARWLAVVFMALGLLAAAAVRRSPPFVAVLATLGAALELLPVGPGRAAPPIPAVYAEVPPGDGVLYDSALVQRRACGCDSTIALLGAWEHDHPLLGGTFARPTQSGRKLNRTAARWPDEEAAALFAEAGVATTIEHPPFPSQSRGECRVVDAHRLCTLPR